MQIAIAFHEQLFGSWQFRIFKNFDSMDGLLSWVANEADKEDLISIATYGLPGDACIVGYKGRVREGKMFPQKNYVKNSHPLELNWELAIKEGRDNAELISAALEAVRAARIEWKGDDCE